MKSILATAAFALGSLLAVAPAAATDIINQDQKSYKITVVDGSYTSTTSVSAGSSLYGVCGSGPCTLKIPGSSITVTKDDKVLINGGKLKKM